ncbi:hypothetical protein C8R46DRAFT_499994 [Mycena filopes]|nr:hypothetical protein C8R46DRAFT_499994 [Mycena filopes]
MPSLPIELQREIVEIAIRANHKDRAVKLNLSLVAHHFHFWVDRVFYESVEIRNSEQRAQFLALVDSKAAGFFTTTVKALSIYAPEEDFQVDRLVVACSGMQAFGFFAIGRSSRTPPLSGLSLRRLAIDTGFAEIINSAVEPAWCSTLTHLDVGFPWLLFDRQMLRRLPCLTNIALHSSSTDRPLADTLYTDYPNLRVLVIFTPDEEQDAAEYRDASHVVLVNELNDLEQEWDTGLFSDFWSRAENIVAGRRKSRVETQLGSQAQLALV